MDKSAKSTRKNKTSWASHTWQVSSSLVLPPTISLELQSHFVVYLNGGHGLGSLRGVHNRFLVAFRPLSTLLLRRRRICFGSWGKSGSGVTSQSSEPLNRATKVTLTLSHLTIRFHRLQC